MPIVQIPYWLLLVLIMLLAGSFAGITSWAWSEDASSSRFVWKYVLRSLLASFTTPLFLRTISSQLIKPPERANPPDADGLLVFAGLCLVVGYFASSYLKGLGAKALADIAETKARVFEVEQAQHEEP